MKLRNKRTGLTGKLTNIDLDIYEDTFHMECDAIHELKEDGEELSDEEQRADEY